jgi:hypothetical protein
MLNSRNSQNAPEPSSKKPRLGVTSRMFPQAKRNISTGFPLFFALGLKAAGEIA